MKKPLIILLGALCFFFISWGVKAKEPISRPQDLAEEYSTPWYNSSYTAPRTASAEWTLDERIPKDHIPVPGQDGLFMIIDPDSGKILGYAECRELDDGRLQWTPVNPDIPEGYEAVAGLDNVYKVSDGKSTSYYLYIRNDDDTFAFLPCDENGQPLDEGSDATSIAENYVQVEDNIFKFYDENGVFVGYRERTLMDDGSYIWEIPDEELGSNIKLSEGVSGNGSGFTEFSFATPSVPQEGGGSATAYSGQESSEGLQSSIARLENGDGTYTETETILDTITEDGYNITRQTDIITTYDMNGNVLYTGKQGPIEISRQKLNGSSGTPDTTLIADTLDGELSRISSKVTFDSDIEKGLLSQLNASRVEQGRVEYKLDTKGLAYKLAHVIAADMAIYNHSSSTSPMYGNIDAMVLRWNIPSAAGCGECLIKTSDRTAAEINAVMNADQSFRETRISYEYSSVGIAVAVKGGEEYVAEIYIK